MPDNILHLFDIISLVEGYAEQGEREYNVAHKGDCASVIRWLHDNKLLDMERVHHYCDKRGVNINGNS